MVALAPIINETPNWDVLDAFQKLHSRAREAKATTCTEAPMLKSRNCIEIWLTIYETCEGLESFTRDPIGYEDGMSLVEFMHASPLNLIDPTGESTFDPTANPWLAVLGFAYGTFLAGGNPSCGSFDYNFSATGTWYYLPVVNDIINESFSGITRFGPKNKKGQAQRLTDGLFFISFVD